MAAFAEKRPYLRGRVNGWHDTDQRRWALTFGTQDRCNNRIGGAFREDVLHGGKVPS